MTYDIFSIDWITVDTIIIVFLLVILISVKLFKQRSRWRRTISNDQIYTREFKSFSLDLNTDKLEIKKAFFSYNTKLQGSQRLLIISVSKKINELITLITQGVVNYGYCMLNLESNSEFDWDNTNKLEKKPIWVEKLLDELNKQMREENLKVPTRVLLIFHSDIPLSIQYIKESSMLSKAIIINPKISKSLITNLYFSEPKNVSNDKVKFIFSGKKYFFLPNNNVKKLQQEISEFNLKTQSLYIVKNATYSFKYHETILIGYILKIIEETEEV
ncbi:MAG: hypothetical protein EU550_01110 [Promethearchaeota archaeon]|nr:MAG: hypothetical protein EU550_01110 [Candidatus Lokiarchaeota archaeon]